MFTPIKLSALAAVLAIGLAAGAHAAPASDTDTVSVKVSIADLNMRSQAGAKVAFQRIHQAATSICGDEPNPSALGEVAQHRACMKSVVARGVASLDNPLVTAMNGGSGRGVTVLASARP
jgi:UrcA family protein